MIVRLVLVGMLVICASELANAQNFHRISDIKPAEDFENIHVHKLYSDSLGSSFVIWVKRYVRPHRHEWHVEQVYVISGEGNMAVGDTTYLIRPGDHIVVPMNTVHSVEVTSNEPLKVISVQAPEFVGKDRVFVD